MSFFWIALVKKINGKMQQMSNCYITFFCSFQKHKCKLFKNTACIWPEYPMKTSFAMQAENSDIQKQKLPLG